MPEDRQRLFKKLAVQNWRAHDATPDHIVRIRRITSALLEREVLTSESTRAPLHLAFPAKLASRWMPGLFPERTG